MTQTFLSTNLYCQSRLEGGCKHIMCENWKICKYWIKMVIRQRDKLLFQVQPEMFTTLWCSLLTRVFHRHRNSMGVDQMDIGQWRCTSFYIWCILIPQSSCLQKTAKVILRPVRPSDFLLKSLWRSSKNNIWIGWDGMIILEGSNEHQRCSSQLAVLSQVASKGTMQGLCVVVPPRHNTLIPAVWLLAG